MYYDLCCEKNFLIFLSYLRSSFYNFREKSILAFPSSARCEIIFKKNRLTPYRR